MSVCLCVTVLGNCLLNVFATCVGEVNVLSLKVMVLFGLCCFLLANPCIVFQRVCVLCSQYVSRCSLPMSDLCVCMRYVISEFNSEIEGSLALCALILFMCSILCLMCSGSIWDVVFVCVENDVCEDGVFRAPNDTAYKQWSCHKLLCKLC